MTGSLLASMTVLVIAAISAALYLLPTLVGWARRVPHLGSIAAINILLGWTLAGWVVAIAMALRSAPTAGPLVQVVQNPPPPAGLPMTVWPAPPPGPATGPAQTPGAAAPGWRPRAAPPARPPSAAPPLHLPPRPSPEPGNSTERGSRP